MHATPIVDRVLTDSLAIPAGADVWLRAVERRARELRRELEVSGRGALAITRLDEVRQQVETLLKDENQSLLHRLLRRPLAQIAPGTPAARTFDAYTTRLFQQAQEVLEAQEAAEMASDRLRSLRTRYNARMPYFTRRLLERHGLREETLQNARRTSDVRMLLLRIGRVDWRLRRLAQHLPDPSEEERVLALSNGEAVSTAELWSTLQLRLRERGRSEQRPEFLERLRLLQAHQIRQLGREGGWKFPAKMLTHVVAEHLAGMSLPPSHEVVTAESDTELWIGLVRAAERARFAPPEPHAWQPRISTPPLDQVRDQLGDTIVYVVPVAEEFVFLSQELHSPVQLWSRTPRDGEVVEARVFGDRGSFIPSELVGSDIAPLFDGTELDQPGWYATQRRASLVVLGRYRNGWFAQLRSRGAVRRLQTPAWQEGESTATAVRVFESHRSTRADRVLLVGANGTEPHQFLGIDTYEVAAPRIGCRTAWLRLPHRNRPSLHEALEREHALFRVLRRRSSSLAVRPLGLAQLSADGATGFLYAPPLAIQYLGASLADEWLRESPRAILRAVVRTVLAVHEAGYALGVYHLNMFAFGFELSGAGGRLQPRATLIAAPFATPLGHTFSSLSIGASESLPDYPRLGFGGFPPAVQRGDVALPETEAAGLALMLLDAMVTHPIDAERRAYTWNDLLTRVDQHATRFVDSQYARRLAHALSSQGDAAGLQQLMQDLLTEHSEAEG